MTFPVSSASHGVVHTLVLVSAWVLNAYGWLSAVPWYWLFALFLGPYCPGNHSCRYQTSTCAPCIGSPHAARRLSFLLATSATARPRAHAPNDAPPRRYARNGRLVCDVSAPTESVHSGRRDSASPSRNEACCM
jgi:hypothetical protein